MAPRAVWLGYLFGFFKLPHPRALTYGAGIFVCGIWQCDPGFGTQSSILIYVNHEFDSIDKPRLAIKSGLVNNEYDALGFLF